MDRRPPPRPGAGRRVHRPSAGGWSRVCRRAAPLRRAGRLRCRPTQFSGRTGPAGQSLDQTPVAQLARHAQSAGHQQGVDGAGDLRERGLRDHREPVVRRNGPGAQRSRLEAITRLARQGRVAAGEAGLDSRVTKVPDRSDQMLAPGWTTAGRGSRCSAAASIWPSRQKWTAWAGRWPGPRQSRLAVHDRPLEPAWPPGMVRQGGGDAGGSGQPQDRDGKAAFHYRAFDPARTRPARGRGRVRDHR